MIKWLWILYFLIVLAPFSDAARGHDYSSLYDQAALQKALQTYEKNLRGLWKEDLLAKLPVQEQAKFTGVRLELPLVGERHSVLDYYADLVSRSRVTISILSVKFLDDIATTLAWLEKKGCNNQLLFDYVGVLRHQGPSGVTGGPLVTFGIPSDVLSDKFIDDVSGKILKSTIYFIAAHEAGHLLYHHYSFDEVGSFEASQEEASQQQEIQADAFALDVMSRIGVAPIALAVFFSITTVFESVPADFQSLSEYKTAFRSISSHPLSSDRLLAVAGKIRQNVVQFARLQKDQLKWQSQLITVAEQIKKLAQEVDSKEIRRDIKRRGLATKPVQFASACH